MTEQARLKEMFGGELAQVDVKAIGKSRGFDAATVASRELMQHGFLSEQGGGGGPGHAAPTGTAEPAPDGRPG
ncbi:MAG TPA: hypothetical protein VNT26_15480 [Candidatus Sulfotelmatobacter sp.]|nr:hypothetical protein [Candidatus Sulfotelmatobacter sp.]